MHESHEVVAPREDRHLQGVDRQITAQRVRHLPADNETTEDVDDEGHVDPARVGLHVGEVRHPETVRCRRHEVTIDEVARSLQRVVADRRDLVAAALLHAGKSELVHQSLDGAARDRDALAIQLLPHFLRAVDAIETGVVDPLDLRLQGLVATTSSGLGTSPSGVVGGGGELQRFADRLDSPSVPSGVDVEDYLFVRPSSSVAKKIEASFKIPFARRRSRFSRSRALSRARSSVVRPTRVP